MNREEIVLSLAHRIMSVQKPHPVRVGIDGVTAAGKTVLADEIAAVLKRRGREVIRATADDFHNPPEVRHRQGRYSPQGYYEDALDLQALRNSLLLPLGPGGSRRYRTGSEAGLAGQIAPLRQRPVSEDAVLLVDGVFLFRPELNDGWDFRIFVRADPALAMARGIERDASWIGSTEEARKRYEERYLPGERLYLDAVRPWELADAVVVNDVPAAPQVFFADKRTRN